MLNLIPLLVIPAVFWCCIQDAAAVPACPAPITVHQPDGRAIHVYLRGDEFCHWNEDHRGFTIIKEPQTNRWVYAVLNAQGKLAPSGLVVGTDDPVQRGLAPRLRPVGFQTRAKAAAQNRLLSGILSQGGPLKTSKTGTMKNLVVLVDFPDLPHTRTKAEFEALFNTVGYSVDGAQGSVKDFYHEVSYNQLTVNSVVADWVTVSHGYAYYGANDAYGYDLYPREMVAEALAKLEANGFDFSTVDSDNDGWVDGLTVIHAGGGEEYSGNDENYIWSHQWEMISVVTYDGKSMWTYHTEPERRGWDDYAYTWGITRIGVICHENGHFLGLPDLYDYGYDSEGAGEFCLMAGGSWNGNYGSQPCHMSAWCKKALGWLAPVNVTASGIYTAPQVEDHQTVYQLGGTGNFPATQYFLIENRQGYGFDASMPGSSRGLLIWHVDETVPNNDDQTHYKVDLEEASGMQNLELDPETNPNANAGNDVDYFRSGTMTTFNYSTVPNSRSYAGAALGQDITSVSASSANMTFTIYMASDSGGTTVLGESNDYDGDGKNDLAVYQNGYWSVYSLAKGIIFNNAGVWGGPGWTTVSGDYDGDGKSDAAIYHDGYWSILLMTGSILFNNAGVWGGPGWTPVPGDYDGDGKSDAAVYHNGYWSILLMTGSILFNNAGLWGGPGWTPVPGDYDGDGRSDAAVYRNGYWSILLMTGSVLLNNAGVWGGPGWTPVPGDYDGDGKTDLAVYNNGYWSIYSLAGGIILNNAGVWGGPGWTPVH